MEPSAASDLVFMLDVDNTLLDNDQAKQDMAAALERILGPADAARFWDLYEAVREETEVVDFPLHIGTLRRDLCRREPAGASRRNRQHFSLRPLCLSPGAGGDRPPVDDGYAGDRLRTATRSSRRIKSGPAGWRGGAGQRAALYPQGATSGRDPAALPGPAAM